MSYKTRPYEETDRIAILDIAGSTWDGHDYLNKELDSIVKNPKSNPFVLEIDDKVIAFANLRIIEHGKTGWMEALRVHSDFREKGYGHIMTNFIVDMAKQKRVSRLRLTLARQNEGSTKLAQSVGMHEVLVMKNLWYGPVSQISWRYSNIELKKVTGSDSYYLLQSNPNLIPDEILIYFWYAIDANLSGLKEVGEIITIWAGRRKNRVESLTFGQTRETQEGPELAVTIYADNKESFLATISGILDVCVSHKIESLMLQYNPAFETFVEDIEWLKSPQHEIALALYERTL